MMQHYKATIPVFRRMRVYASTSGKRTTSLTIDGTIIAPNYAGFLILYA